MTDEKNVELVCLDKLFVIRHYVPIFFHIWTDLVMSDNPIKLGLRHAAYAKD